MVNYEILQGGSSGLFRAMIFTVRGHLRLGSRIRLWKRAAEIDGNSIFESEKMSRDQLIFPYLELHFDIKNDIFSLHAYISLPKIDLIVCGLESLFRKIYSCVAFFTSSSA